MRFGIVAGVALAALAAPPAADACTRLPAASASRVGVIATKPDTSRTRVRTVLRVCAGGRPVVLRRAVYHRDRDRDRVRGIRVGAASAAGNRVAWIEVRHTRAGRRAHVRAVRISPSGDVRPIRRIPVLRDRSRLDPDLDVLLTREGDLAWLWTDYGQSRGAVAVRRADGRTRVLDRYGANGPLVLEDGRTLRWNELQERFFFYDLRHAPCPSRARFKPFKSTTRVLLSRAHYGVDPWPLGVTVIRGCDLATGRDRVLDQQYRDFRIGGEMEVVGIDRTWVLTEHYEYGGDCESRTITTADVASGRVATTRLGCTPLPTAAAFAITDPGAAAWISGDVLYAAARGKVVELDRGGALATLRADGAAVTWTRDGAPRRAIP